MNHTVLCVADAWKACSPWGGFSSGYCIFTIVIFGLSLLSIILGVILFFIVRPGAKLIWLSGKTMSDAFSQYYNGDSLTFNYVMWPVFFTNDGVVPVPADHEDVSFSSEDEVPSNDEELIPIYYQHQHVKIYGCKKNNQWTKNIQYRGGRVPNTQLIENIRSISKLHGIAVAIGGVAAISTNLAIVFFSCSGKAWARLYTTYNVIVLIWTMPLTILYITKHLARIHTIVCAQGMTDVMAGNRNESNKELSRSYEFKIKRGLPRSGTQELADEIQIFKFKSEDDRSKWVRLSAACNPGSFDPLWWMEPLKTSHSTSNEYDTIMARRIDMYTRSSNARDTLQQTCGGFLSIALLSVTLMVWERWWKCDVSLLEDVRGIRNNLASTILILWNVTVGLAAIAVFNLGKAGMLLEEELENIVHKVTGKTINKKRWWIPFPMPDEFYAWISSFNTKMETT